MGTWSWPGLRKLRAILGRANEDSRQKLTLEINLATIGTAERVAQCKAFSREWQRMAEDAADAYKVVLRGG